MLGLFEGKIDIQMNGFNFKPGDTVQGTATLTLNKNIKARGLIVSLIGETQVRTVNSHGSHYSTQRVFDLGYPLDGEKEYPAGTPMTYQFRIIIPSNILGGSAPSAAGGALGMVMDIAAQSLGAGSLSIPLGQTPGLIQWYIFARLDMPLAFDISKKIRINIV